MSRQRRRGYSLVEAFVALSITALAGSVILVAVEASLVSTEESVESTIANGIALQMVDEALGKRYIAEGGDPYQYPLCPSTWEEGGKGRERYNDIDDYHGFTVSGAEDLWGESLGNGNEAGGKRHANFRVSSGYFGKWSQKVEVYYVDESDYTRRLPNGQTSNVRALEVTISKQDADGTTRVLATQRRIHAYVPHY